VQNRRLFLRHAGLAAATAAASTACRRVPTLQAILGAFSKSGACPLAAAAGTLAPVPRCLSRLAYGPRSGDVERAAAMGDDAWIEEQLAPASIPDLPARWRVRPIETVALGLPDLFDYARPTVLTDLRRATILRAVYSQRQLFERMVEFWSDHFNVYVGKADCAWLKVVDDREVIRRHALGSFRDLLRASATSPAMLVYLDGEANAAGKPNENYAREVMELHTLGVDGGYTQRDVMELARALTGWRVRSAFWRGRIFFEKIRHDPGIKEVLDLRLRSGPQRDLDEILDRLCAHPSTARHLAGKLVRRFVSEDPAASLVLRVAGAFTASRGDIRKTLSALVHSEEFRRAPDKFRRPFDFTIATLRAADAATDGERALQDELARMGQLPFDWPTPDGFPDDAAPWRARLLPRWNFALDLAAGRVRGTALRTELLQDPARLASALLRRPLRTVEKRALALAGPGPEAAALALCHPQLQVC
jgi:uncharacterized protein (DUF1800 family)